jgi:ribonuclease HI
MVKRTLLVFTDGGARGNPGPAAVGFVVKGNRGRILIRQGKFIGRATNNKAEYRAIIEALKWLALNVKSQILSIQFYLDSQLVVNQLNGIFKIKNADLRNLIVEVRQREKKIGGNVSYHFIPREKNKEADNLVNQSLN